MTGGDGSDQGLRNSGPAWTLRLQDERRAQNGDFGLADGSTDLDAPVAMAAVLLTMALGPWWWSEADSWF